ncbi:MAG: 50S ribosomal protein L17 [Firmicutes bacterium]|nr:50S ribosomal protein L17 [Bacillota bacterium]
MAEYRKLGRNASQRKALLRNQVTNLLYHGKIKTTVSKAKEVRSIAEKLITLAVKEKDNFTEAEVVVKQTTVDKNGNKTVSDVTKTIKKDAPSRLNARRKMLSVLYPVTEVPAKGRKKRTLSKEVNLPNHLFENVAPKYEGRNGGYTRIIKLGMRRGDAAEIVILELI